MVAPGIYCTYKLTEGPKRSALLSRRIKLAGWFLGAVSLVVFPNIFLFPQQLQRRFDPSNSVLLPDDEHIIKLRAMFYANVSMDNFNHMHFYDQMYEIDKFIAKVIIWKNDYSVYELSGLLLSPIEVLEHMSGDCQGQAVTTASLLLSMGFHAWVVETPFHWWTHVEDPDTGLVTNLNVHGHGGQDGNVRPQPIDLVYTRPIAQCTGCPYDFANNHEPLFYAAPPHRAFAIALTGTHIFVRSGFTITDISPWLLIGYGLAFAVIIAMYATYYQADEVGLITKEGFVRFLKRYLVSAIISVGPLFFGMATWATLYYPFTTIHGIGFVTLMLSYVSSDKFNTLIEPNQQNRLSEMYQ